MMRFQTGAGCRVLHMTARSSAVAAVSVRCLGLKSRQNL